ncbi:MAG: AraC family transcriptional regulator [Clostridiales bacterium]|nr:AraC family transcriptional regulator [Clostridiales bacterium]
MRFFEVERSPAGLYLNKEYGEDLNFARHMHKSFEFIDVFEGEIQLRINGRDEVYQIRDGQAALIMPYQIHSYITPVNSKYIMAIFSAEYVRTFYEMSDIGNRTAELPVFEYPNHDLSKALLNADESDLLTVKALLYSICAIFNKQIRFRDRNENETGLIDRIIRYVEKNYRDNISLKRIAEELNYNYQYTSKIFSSYMGVNFRRFLNEYRIHEACALLEENIYSVTEVADACGFDSLRSFDREFIAITGISPREYKKNKF